MLLEEIQGPEGPEEKVYILDISLLLFRLEHRLSTARAMTQGIKDLPVLENTHRPLKCGSVNVSFLQTSTL